MQSERKPALDRELIDKLGNDVVRGYFGVTPQRLHNWRTRGIPFRQRIAFHNLALANGVTPPPEFLAPLGIAA